MDTVLYDKANHKYVLLGFADSPDEKSVPSNQYMIVHNDTTVLMDPGGFTLFPVLVARVLKYTKMENIKAILLSHQDPDVNGGLSVWEKVTSAKIYISKIWVRFIPHYEIRNTKNIIGINDGDTEIIINDDFKITVIPAHFLHSPGQFNYYDSASKILFTGDIGASVLPCSGNSLFIEDFEEFLPCIEPFHTRYMSCNKALRKWVKDIEAYDIDIIAPQHGYLMRGEVKEQFIQWLYDLKCGVDLI
ncbi:MBL fold metallo-hydrolase [Candidatus Magnetomonas plexicatena]|uniref:MBL fold metallo-hydrolase n=1 Tax=Candidatus Magnetomonas plexicatena TaxID=2552947 RepID=UPI001C7760A2|nr:MBL fold metallo-hydrolase [Nitrospirales bacterium LBB_01]